MSEPARLEVENDILTIDQLNPPVFEAPDQPLSDIDRDMRHRRQALNERVAGNIMSLLKLSTFAITLMTIVLAAVDTTFIYQGVIDPSDRLVDDKVLMAVIGATIVQVGAASLAIVYALFGREPMPEIASD